jgi:hypothetical protein
MTIESAVIRSRFAPTKTTGISKVPPTTTSAPTRITADSFLQHVCLTALPRIWNWRAGKTLRRPWPFWTSYIYIGISLVSCKSRTLPDSLVGCARDPARKYRVKNHSKSQVAIFGSSNLAPALQAATSDLDAIVMGPAAASLDGHGKTRGMCISSAIGRKKEEEPSACSSSSRLAQAIASEPWADTNSRVAAAHTVGTHFGRR